MLPALEGPSQASEVTEKSQSVHGTLMSQGEYYLSHSVFVWLTHSGLEVAVLTCLNSGYLEFLEHLVGLLSFLAFLKKLENDLSNFL